MNQGKGANLVIAGTPPLTKILGETPEIAPGEAPGVVPRRGGTPLKISPRIEDHHIHTLPRIGDIPILKIHKEVELQGGRLDASIVVKLAIIGEIVRHQGEIHSKWSLSFKV